MADRPAARQPGRVPAATAPAEPVTGADLAGGLRQLGVAAGGIVMVHASLSRLGWVAGGSETVIRALLAATGTVCAQVCWRYAPLDLAAGAPLPFDPATAEAARFEGRVAERLRTWPGALRSANADTGVAAVGDRARWLVEPHAHDDGFGPETPYARLVEAGGQVVLLGAPLEAISLLHHAEAIARVRERRRVHYRLPLRGRGGEIVWRECEDIDVRRGPVPYEDVLAPGGGPPLAVIAAAALDAGLGERATIGAATCHRFDAAPLVRFAREWLEARFA
jgi:aminoglycoside 3-N-acetyltransferase